MVKLRVIAVTQVRTHPWENEHSGESGGDETRTRFWAVDEDGDLWSCRDGDEEWTSMGLPALNFEIKEEGK